MSLCHCGSPLHYAEPDQKVVVDLLVALAGEFVIVRGTDGRRWRVQRHYLALHGLNEVDLPDLGFDEAVD